MNAPPIQYCRTDDGVNIAYWTLGEGPTVVIVEDPGGSHVALEWDIPAYRRFYLRLAEQFRVVRYNPRCSGLSECVEDITLAAYVRDLAALAEALGPDPVGLLSVGFGSNFTNAFAAENPSSVSALASLGPLLDLERAMAYLRSMVGGAGERGPQTLKNWMDPHHVDPNEPFEHFIRNAHPPTERDRLRASKATWKPYDPLPAMQVPTLVLHYVRWPWSGGPEMAARVPNAVLVHRESDGYPPFYDDDPDGLFDLLVPFFLEHAPSSSKAPPATAGGDPKPDAASRLTKREIEVLHLIADGASNPQIAEQLVISPGTAARHVTNILNKTGCRNRAEAARYAAEHGLIGD